MGLTWAHPRSRGENDRDVFPGDQAVGSSPLARAKRLPRSWSTCARRLIPARAGKTAPSSPSSPSRGAHPRSRGENCSSSVQRWFVTGSSPLARGKLDPEVAGFFSAGSSPLARGKLACRSPSHLLPRLIPARAGKTSSARWSTGRWPGSSPLARGKQARPGGQGKHCRLIPARAGKTLFLFAPPLCGGGSSPLARGKRSRDQREGYASTAHPRSRGENVCCVHGGHVAVGSSPLARGKPCKGSKNATQIRLIPARVGKTTTALTA